MSKKPETDVNPLDYFDKNDLEVLKTQLKKTIVDVNRSKSLFQFNQVLKQLTDKNKVLEKEFSHIKENFYFVEATKALWDILEEEGDLLHKIDVGKTPKYTTKELYMKEIETISLAKYKTEGYRVPKELIQKAVDEMPYLSDEQREAALFVMDSDNMVSIYQGWAGAGKSFTSKSIMNGFVYNYFATMGIALSWKAAFVLQANSGIDRCMAIRKFIVDAEKTSETGGSIFKEDTLLIVDEAGLVSTREMHSILNICHSAYINHGIKVKVVLTGDELQLAPVNAGAMFSTLIRHLGSKVIKQIRRQEQDSQKNMVKYSALGYSGIAMYTLLMQENFVWAENAQKTRNLIVRDYISYKLAHPDRTTAILAETNETVAELNNKIRSILKKLKMLDDTEERKIYMSNGEGGSAYGLLCKGDQIVIRKNYATINLYNVPEDEDNLDISTYKVENGQVFNRMNGKVVAVKESKRIKGSHDVYIDLGEELAGKRIVLNTREDVDENNALPIHHNYAMTIYSSQGQTVNKSFIIYEGGMSMNTSLFLVAISRHKDDLTYYLDENLLHKACDVKEGLITRQEFRNKDFKVKLGRHSRIRMLHEMSSLCGRISKNQTVDDYIFSETNPIEEIASNEERFEIRPMSLEEDIYDYDKNRSVIVKKEDYENEENYNKFWAEMYYKVKNYGNYSEKLWNEVVNESEEFLKFKKNVYKNTGVEEGYIFEEGDRVYFQPKISEDYPRVDLTKLIGGMEEDYETAELVPETLVKIQSYREGMIDFIPEQEEKEIEEAETIEVQNESVEKNTQEEIKRDKLTDTSVWQNYFSLERLMSENVDDFIKNQQEDDKKENEIKLEFLPMPEKNLYIDLKGNIQVKNKAEWGGGEEILSFINEDLKEIFWVEGKYHEPRFLAKDGNDGVVKEMYNELGEPILGTGFPLMLENISNNDKVDIILVPDVNKLIWTFYSQTNKVHSDENLSLEDKIKKFSELPDIALGNKVIDYGLIKERIVRNNKTVKIAKGLGDKHEKWALELQQSLWDKWQIKSKIIVPKTELYLLKEPHYTPPWEREPEKELTQEEKEHYDVIRNLAKR